MKHDERQATRHPAAQARHRTTDPKQAAKLDAKLAADGFSGLQDMVDQYIAKNGSEAA